jgi:HEAT repeat protein
MRPFRPLLALVLAGICLPGARAAEATADANRQAVRIHIERLGDPTPAVRQAAAEALGQLRSEAGPAVPALTKILKAKDSSLRRTAVASLGKIGPDAAAAAPALAGLLRDGDLAWDAIMALGKIGRGAGAAAPALAELLKGKSEEPDPNLEVVLLALGKMGPAAAPAVPALAQYLKSKDSYWRPLAALALARVGPGAKAAVPTLAGLLKDGGEDIGFRQLVASALAEVGVASIPTFMELLEGKDERAQCAAVFALGQIGPQAGVAVPALARLAGDKQAAVRQAAARTLGKIGPGAKAAIPVLTALLKDKDVLVRWAAAVALGQIGPDEKTSAPAAADALNDGNREVRDAAASALGRDNLQASPAPAETERIRKLIAALAAIDAPDVGFSPTMAGSAFAPVASWQHFDTFTVTHHGLRRNAAFTSLVQLGPTALPLLLEALDDKTPTKLVIAHEGGMGSMWLGHEISGNPLNVQETRLLADVTGTAQDWLSQRRDPGPYTVKVGDICFVAIGQITNRAYMAVRYQPTGCIVVNSPVEDKELAAEVRAIWGQSGHRRKLLDSLLVDFRVPDFGFEAGAAVRLAYYFPDAAENLIIARLDELQAAAGDGSEAYAGPELGEMIGALCWSTSPAFRAKLLEIFRSTKAPPALLAAIPALGKQHDELLLRRIREQLDTLSENSREPFGNYEVPLLVALGNRFPDRAETEFRNYLKPGTVGRRVAVSCALQQACGNLAVPLLGPLLEDKRLGGLYTVSSGEGAPPLPLRVCDEAAATIAMHSTTLKFRVDTPREDADRQIEVMRRKIAAGER